MIFKQSRRKGPRSSIKKAILYIVFELSYTYLKHPWITFHIILLYSVILTKPTKLVGNMSETHNLQQVPCLTHCHRDLCTAQRDANHLGFLHDTNANPGDITSEPKGTQLFHHLQKGHNIGSFNFFESTFPKLGELV